MPKPVSPASALSRLPKAGLVRTYVWEKPVRIAHWLIFFAFVSLAFTGLYIHRPFLLSGGRARFPRWPGCDSFTSSPASS